MILLGRRLYGFCNGYFGRDSYETKIIEAIGYRWIVAREIDSQDSVFAKFASEEEMNTKIKDWGSEEEKIKWENY